LSSGHSLVERRQPRLGPPDGGRGSRARTLRAGTRADLGRVDGRGAEGARAQGARRQCQGGRDPHAGQGNAPSAGRPDDRGVSTLGRERAGSRPTERGRPSAARRGDRGSCKEIPTGLDTRRNATRRGKLIVDAGGPADLDAGRSVDVLVIQPARLRHLRLVDASRPGCRWDRILRDHVRPNAPGARERVLLSEGRSGVADAEGERQPPEQSGAAARLEALWKETPLWGLDVVRKVGAERDRDDRAPGASSTTEIVARSCQVAGEETVTVAGGIFNTVKTVCRDTTTNEVVYEMWDAPEAKHWVKEWTRFSWGVLDREIMAVKLK